MVASDAWRTDDRSNGKQPNRTVEESFLAMVIRSISQRDLRSGDKKAT
jgi:hypothetical protein